MQLLRAIVSALASPLVLYFFVRDLLRVHKASSQVRRALYTYSQVAWAEVWQRPQEFAMRAAFDGTVIYCCPVQVHTWLFNLRKRWKSIEQLRNDQVIVLSPLVLPGHFKSSTIFSINIWIIGILSRAIQRKASDVFVVLNTPLGQPALEELRQNPVTAEKLRRVSYDIIDDFPAFSWAPSFSRKLENDLLLKADAVVTGTYELKEMHLSRRHDIEFIQSGVDFLLFNTPAPPPVDLQPIPKPYIGYFGTISERIDLSLIELVATEFPDASVLMIGPVHLPAHLLPRAANLHYLGLKAHNQLPALAQQFSVAMIPFKISDATIRLNPIKTLEYLAAGAPVVSTAIPDVERFFSHVVAIARTHDQFLAHIHSALDSRNEKQVANGIEVARSASWEAMAARMSAIYTNGGGTS